MDIGTCESAIMESSEGVDGGIMPVPFPAVGQAKVVPPDAVEARLIAGGVAGAVSTAGGLTSLQRVMIEAVTESMTGFVVPLSVLPRLGPDEFAASVEQSR